MQDGATAPNRQIKARARKLGRQMFGQLSLQNPSNAGE
jgi:hypothetical protein